MENSNCISISGLLENLLCSGFTTRDCIGEMLDNSIGAKANNINIILDTKLNILIFSDDGYGMTIEELSEAHILHKRTTSSIDKDGRFGIGGKHSRSHFTKNSGIAKTISRSITTINDNNYIDNLNQIEIDYNSVIKNNIMIINPHGIEYKNINIWDKYSINKISNGTITYINCHQTIIDELQIMFESNDVCNSLIYYIGSVYNEVIKLGTNIKIIYKYEDHSNNKTEDNTREYIINPIDPIEWSKILDENRQEINIELYTNNNEISNISNTSKINCYYEDNKDINKIIFRDYSSSSKGKNIDLLKKNFYENNKDNKIGNITLKLAYSNDWESLKKESLVKNKIKINAPSLTIFKNVIIGTSIIRNKKIIKSFPNEPPKAGDKCNYPFHLNIIKVIKFEASNVLDDLFTININKSRIDEDNINTNIHDTIKYFIDIFIKNMHKKYCETHKINYNLEPKTIIKNNFKDNVINNVNLLQESIIEPIIDNIIAPIETIKIKPKKITIKKTIQVPEQIPEQITEQAQVPEQVQVPLEKKNTIMFSKTSKNIIVSENKKILYKIPYYCQYNIIELYYNETLTKIGEDKFKKWIAEQNKINKLI